MSQTYRLKIENNYSGSIRESIVYCESQEAAILGAGVSQDETATVEAINAWDLGLGALRLKKLPSAKDLSDFYSGLCECLKIGTNMVDSLGIVALQQESPYFKGAIGQIILDLRQGHAMSEGMAEFPDIFTPSTVAIIRAGESSGDLPKVFAALAVSEDRSSRIVGKLKAGLTYPAIVLVLAFAAVMYMSTTLVPNIAKQYANMHAELPFATKAVVAFSDLVRTQPLFWISLAIGITWLGMNAKRIAQSPTILKIFSYMPILGDMYKNMLLARVFRVLSMLLGGGVRLSRAFEIASVASNSETLRQALTHVGQRMVAGDELHVAFSRNQHIFGNNANKIIAFLRLATHTGDPSPILTKIAENIEENVEAKSDVVDKLIEPMLLGVLAVVVGGMIFAVYYPMFNLGQIVLNHQ